MKVLLIDDHAMFREGIALLLRPLVAALEVWEAGSCAEAFGLLSERGAAELILIDLGLPGMSGLEGIACLREAYPSTPVVALSSSDDRDTVLQALDAGAMGFIPKASNSAILLSALRLILAHGIYLPPSVFLAGLLSSESRVNALDKPQEKSPEVSVQVSGLLTPTSASRQAPSAPSPAAPHGVPGRSPVELGLTPRQAEVLYLILQGKPAKLICRELDLAAGTVKAHTSAVLRALNVTTRTQAVIAASRLGLRFDGVPHQPE